MNSSYWLPPPLELETGDNAGACCYSSGRGWGEEKEWCCSGGNCCCSGRGWVAARIEVSIYTATALSICASTSIRVDGRRGGRPLRRDPGREGGHVMVTDAAAQGKGGGGGGGRDAVAAAAAAWGREEKRSGERRWRGVFF
ncbi:hypothetical protein PR202_gb10170 [Eleusine coracana subsp. coracana]|uniref:Uncharacterized protein n=1 Tax=Eleusine coracana subsp. coracana TaxID=191504 RepID=A0AAV5EJE8_ELECO|nr:hypothetical protein PR202_gb10170 [Eleusine coracana subsp. coracana]